MSTDIRDEIMQALCHELSNDDLDKMVATIQLKLSQGYTVEQTAAQLLTATAQTIAIAAPDMDDDEILELAEDVCDAIIDKLLDYMGYPIDAKVGEVPPREQLN